MTQPDPAQPPTPAAPAQPPEAPPWGENFDAEKAWNLIQNLRADKEKLAKRPVLDEDAQRKLSEYQRLEEASKTELERKTEELTRWQSEAEKWRTASVGHRIEALAATDFADPTDAVNALDPTKYLDAGGQIDGEAIKRDLAALLEAKPHYRRQQETAGSRLPAPNPAQGHSTSTTSDDPAQQFAALLQGRLA